MSNKISYIEKDKIKTYLKLGKKLVQFVKWDRFFGQRTFDWILLETYEEMFRATLIRSLDEKNADATDITAFHTVNESRNTFHELENPFYIGRWEEVWNWMLQYPIDSNQFIKPEDLCTVYLVYKKSN